jgi:hypothetical protein
LIFSKIGPILELSMERRASFRMTGIIQKHG